MLRLLATRTLPVSVTFTQVGAAASPTALKAPRAPVTARLRPSLFLVKVMPRAIGPFVCVLPVPVPVAGYSSVCVAT